MSHFGFDWRLVATCSAHLEWHNVWLYRGKSFTWYVLLCRPCYLLGCCCFLSHATDYIALSISGNDVCDVVIHTVNDTQLTCFAPSSTGILRTITVTSSTMNLISLPAPLVSYSLPTLKSISGYETDVICMQNYLLVSRCCVISTKTAQVRIFYVYYNQLWCDGWYKCPTM